MRLKLHFLRYIWCQDILLHHILRYHIGHSDEWVGHTERYSKALRAKDFEVHIFNLWFKVLLLMANRGYNVYATVGQVQW